MAAGYCGKESELKILLLNASYPPNESAGAERVVQTLAEGLVSRGHEVVLVTSQPQGAATVRESRGVRVYYIPVTNVYRPFAGKRPGILRRSLWHLIDSCNVPMARRLFEVIDAERPDVVNSHNLVGLSSAVLPLIASGGIPLVHTLHDQYFLCPKGTMFRKGRNCGTQCFGCRTLSFPRRSNSQAVDVVVGVSNFILDRHVSRGFFPNASARVIYNAFDAAAVPVGRRCRAGRPFRFGFLGQVRDTKGVHRLVAAFSEECALEAELWIAGKGDDAYETAVRANSSSVPTIRWMGLVKPSELMGEIDVLVVPSLWNDTAPLVLLEAFASGVPVVGAARGGVPEFIDPTRGWLFDPEDIADFRRTLRKCLESSDTLMAMASAASKYSSGFTSGRFLDEYLDVYTYAATLRRHMVGAGGVEV